MKTNLCRQIFSYGDQFLYWYIFIDYVSYTEAVILSLLKINYMVHAIKSSLKQFQYKCHGVLRCTIKGTLLWRYIYFSMKQPAITLLLKAYAKHTLICLPRAVNHDTFSLYLFYQLRCCCDRIVINCLEGIFMCNCRSSKLNDNFQVKFVGHIAQQPSNIKQLKDKINQAQRNALSSFTLLKSRFQTSNSPLAQKYKYTK